MSSQRRPYPGLRAFTADEADLFFGRDGCVDEMVDLLDQERFLAVLGPSGGGKSSLVRTGLFDALKLGFLQSAGASWHIVDMNPSGGPMKQLAAALLRSRRVGSTAVEPSAGDIAGLEKLMREGPRSLALWARDNVPAETSLLLLVDQFEELFRYESYKQKEEAEAFVSLLIESAVTDKFPIYVVITMRSDYLGACSSIDRLAERISSSLYLTPRMEREACRAAIEGPSGVTGFDIEPALVNRMLNDLAMFAPRSADTADEFAYQLAQQADQLPLMQHVLNRLWLKASDRQDGDTELKLADYLDLKEMKGAIDDHGQELINSLSEQGKAVVEIVFRALVTGNSVAAAVRRPTRFGDLVALAGGRRGAVEEVVKVFRAESANFLKAPQGRKALSESGQQALDDRPIDDDAEIDISHESLIRQWQHLRTWLENEIRDEAQWRQLLDRVNFERDHPGVLLEGVILENYKKWWEDAHSPHALILTPAWAAQHGGNYKQAEDFLKRSAKEEQRRIRTHRVRFWGATAASLAMIAIGLWLFSSARTDRKNAAAALNEAVASKDQAAAAQIKAFTAKSEADTMKATAENEQLQAKLAFGRADAQEENLYGMLAKRHSDDPFHEIYWLNKAYAVHSRSSGKDSNSPDAQDRDLREFYTIALQKAQGQVRLSDVHSLPLTAAWYTTDGHVALTRDDKKLAIWDAQSSKLLNTIDGIGKILSATTSPNSQLLIVTTETGNAYLYRLPSGKLIAQLDTTDAGSVISSAFSSDSATVAAGSKDGYVRVWNIADLSAARSPAPPSQTLKSPDAEKAVIYRLSFVGKPQRPSVLAAEVIGDDDKSKQRSTARVWSLQTGKETANRPFQGYLTSLACAADSTCVLAGSREVQIWNPLTNVHFDLAAQNVEHAVFSHNGKWVVTTSVENATRWNPETAESYPLRGHTADINEVIFSKDDKSIITASDDGTAKIWDTESGGLRLSLESHGKINAADMDPAKDNQLLTASDDHTATVWDLGKVFKPQSYVPRSGNVRDVALSPDDAVAAIAGDDGGILFDLRTGKTVDSPLQGSKASKASFSPNGRYVAFGGNNFVYVWDRQKRQRAYANLKGKTILLVRFSPDNRWIVTLSEDHEAVIWDAATGQRVDGFKLDGSHIYDANFDPSGRNLVIVGENGTGAVYTWNNGAWKQNGPLIHQKGKIYRGVFNRDGSRFITGSEDETAVVWETSTGKPIATLRCLSAVRDVRFSPDEKVIATSGEQGAVQLWGPSGAHIADLVGQTGDVFSAHFNAAGTLLSTASWDGSLRVWDVLNHQAISSIEEGPTINQAVFARKDNADGSALLAVASEDGRASFWRILPTTKSLDQLAKEATAPQFIPDSATAQNWDEEKGTISVAASPQNFIRREHPADHPPDIPEGNPLRQADTPPTKSGGAKN